ncbi:TPA: Bifunctional aspartokinase/homoserine dehydrogenase 1, chloroplastic [Trebouxia sp. C0005]|nr:MAG: bifunctional aspartate kinase homoserine dehydrogenase [Trebouxia sp. A1-2]
MAAGTTFVQGRATCHTNASGQHSMLFRLQRHAASIRSYSGLNPSRNAELRQQAATTCRRVSSRSSVSRATVSAIAVDAPPLENLETCPRGAHWQVHKFGGTCVASADRIREAAQLVCSDLAEQKVVVVSAMGSHPTSLIKVTDVLLNMVAKASRQDEGFLLDLAAIQEKHVETAKLLLVEGHALNSFVSRLLDDIANLKAMLRAISIAGMATEAFTDFVVGHGELWSALLFAATVKTLGSNCQFMDTREVLVVTPTSDGNSVDIQYDLSNDRLDAWVRKNGAPEVIVATGFIAKNPLGQVTTLKRNGSDYSATTIGALFQASQITIWTDVDGVYSADPRKVPEAVCLPSLSYHEAWELSYFGANVLHPRTTLPAMRYSIPIAIRNFFNLAAPGTQISDVILDIQTAGFQTVKGFATIDHVALINVEGTGMVGVPGTASTLFSAVRDANVNVIMISQASSEHSICFAVKQIDADRTLHCLHERFNDAIRSGRIHHIEAIDNCCILAAVGQQMASRKGVSATMFSALAKSNINIRSIAQGCSEYNITVLIDGKDSVRALRAVHSRFYLATLPLAVGIVGPGAIGGTFMRQLQQQKEALGAEYNMDVRVLGITGSRQMMLSEHGINLEEWEEQYSGQAEAVDMARFADHLANSYIPNTVIIDATASEAPPALYLQWMQKGIHIITPNKKLGSGPLDQYLALRHFQRESYIHFFYEATVGAGLPVIATLKHLVDTGDRILKVEGIFSGTLSYIFNMFSQDKPFSEIVTEAKALGYTEPDPRDDLAGMDVARKVTILAREAGLNLELDDVAVQSLVPAPLQNVASADDFMQQLPQYDADLAQQVSEADAAGECLRFVGVVDCVQSSGSVELKRYPKRHPFAQLSGSDNIIAFTTQRYQQQPLIIRGPGAGAEVTAGGVFSDLLRLAAYLGAPS